MFGKSPTTPNRTAVNIVKLDAVHAFQNAFLKINKRVARRAITVISGRINRIGLLR